MSATRHPQNNGNTRYLTAYLLHTHPQAKGVYMSGVGEKINENCPAVKNAQNDFTSKVELLNPGAPVQMPRPSQTHSDGDCSPAILICVQLH